jgi:hypothetical protein
VGGDETGKEKGKGSEAHGSVEKGADVIEGNPLVPTLFDASLTESLTMHYELRESEKPPADKAMKARHRAISIAVIVLLLIAYPLSFGLSSAWYMKTGNDAPPVLEVFYSPISYACIYCPRVDRVMESYIQFCVARFYH